MTIHRAKGLEFPVVCVADLGRLGAGGRAAAADRPRRRGRAAARAARRRRRRPGARLRAARRRGGPRGRRGGAAAALRRDDPRPRDADPLRRRPTPSAGPSRAPAARRSTGSCRALAGEPRELFASARPSTCSSAAGTAAPARVRCALNSPATLGAVLPRAALRPSGGPRRGAPATALPKAPKVMPAPPVRAAAGAAAALLHRAAGVRALRLPLLPPARARPAAPSRRRRPPRPPRPRRAPGSTRACAARSPTRCSRRSTSPAPSRPPPDAVAALADAARRRGHGRRRRGPARDRRRVRRARRCASGSPPRAPSAARPASRSRSSRAAAARSSTASST